MVESILRTAGGRGGGFPSRCAAPFRLARRVLLCFALANSLLTIPVPARAVLRIHIYGSVTFPDADPDTTPVVGPEPIRVRVLSFGPGRGVPWTLTMQADEDLTAGPEIIPAANVSWTATPSPPFQDGVLSTVVPILLGSGRGDTRIWGQLNFYLQNSWSYIPGDYSTTTTITLSAP
jgi:hypothetical protein